MENASKALLISGGILIAILVLTLGVTLYINAKGLGEEYDRRQETIDIQKFNTTFTKFQGRDNITAQEIATLYNYVENYKKTNGITIQIAVENDNNFSSNMVEFIKENTNKYSLKDIGYGNDGKCNKIIFRKK